MIDWNKALDDVRAKFGLQNDAQLADWLGFTRSMLSQVRAGKKLPLAKQIAVLDKAGYAWARDNILSLLPAESQTAIRNYDNERFLNKISRLESLQLEGLFQQVDLALERYSKQELEEILVDYMRSKSTEE